MKLRNYQTDVVHNIYRAWEQDRNVIAVLPTGAGKTVCLSHIVHDFQGVVCVVAHRQELVIQLSMALACEEVYHDIVAPVKVVKAVVGEHTRELGKRYYRAGAKVMLGSIQTLKARAKKSNTWFDTVGLWVIDEAHHCQKKNMWGIVTTIFPNAYGLGVTATPVRANGCGLGSWNDGIFDTMVEGVQMAELIEMGFLSPYKIYTPDTDIKLLEVKVSSATGDYVPTALDDAMKDSTIIGDVTHSYKKFADGKQAIVFATSVDSGQIIADKFREIGVSAVMLSAKSTDEYRQTVVRRFRNGELKVLVNKDLFGEGFDVPSVECVIMARPTCSYAVYSQQFGRALRIMKGKSHAIIIDHVGNVIRHGLPDQDREWSLERIKRNAVSNTESDTPVKACPQCTFVFEAYIKACPECGFIPTPADRSEPQSVAGELSEMSEELLEMLRGRKNKVDCPADDMANAMRNAGAEPVVYNSVRMNHRKAQGTQNILRDTINTWATTCQGLDKGSLERKFYSIFKIDTLSAQSLGRKDAINLVDRISKFLERNI